MVSHVPFQRFLQSEDGSTTADWIVLTAGVVGLGITGVSATRIGVNSLGTDISGSLRAASVAGAEDPTAGTMTVIASGRGVAWTDDPVCDKSGSCTPAVNHITMTYQVSDGSWWTMSSTGITGQPAQVTWTDATGNNVPAPTFPPG